MSGELELQVNRARAATTGGANVPDVPQVGSAVEMKSRLQEARLAVQANVSAAVEAQASARAIVDAKKRELEAMIRGLDAELAPLRAKMERFEDGIAAVQLYLGRGEEVVVISDGEPAPAGTPVMLRQQVLAMDEETAIAAGEGGIDFRDIDVFADWLRVPENLQQVLPEQKGIVACQPRRQAKDYSDDPLLNAKLNENNWYTYWLIRNGERLWLTTGEFIVGSTICPKLDEFTGLFRGRDGKPLSPGSHYWVEAEKKADRMTRHYMKVAMLLQGINDRTAVLDPKPAGLSFIDQASYERGEVVLITDSELAIGTGRPSFPKWIAEKRAELTEGMRIAFDPSYSLGYRVWNRDYEPANAIPQGLTPEAGIYQAARYDGAEYGFEFKFLFARTDQIWNDRTGYSTPKKKAGARFGQNDDFWIPVDNLTLDEINYYLESRSERAHYLKLIPLLRQVRDLLAAEREAQTPFAQALAGRLMADLGVDAADAVDMAWELVCWYRSARKWQEPVQADDAKAYVQTIAEAKRRLRAHLTGDVVVRAAKALPGELMAVARRSSGYLAVYRQETAHENLKDRPFVRITLLTAKGELKGEEPWQLLKRAQVSRWMVLHQTEAFTELSLDVARGAQLTDDEVKASIERCRAMYPDDELLSVRVGKTRGYRSQSNQHVEAWWLSSHKQEDRYGRVSSKADEPDLRRRKFEINESTIAGGFSFYRDTVALDHRDNFRDEGFSYPWEVGGDVSADLEVFHDAEVAQKAMTLADVNHERQREQNVRRNFVYRLAGAAEKLVTDEHEGELRARYVDDYGTEIGYAEWRRGIKVTVRRVDGLTGRLVTAVTDGHAIGGRRLGDLYPDMELWAAADYVIPAPVGGSAG
ncbi:hypothetical protein [Leucobacter sp. cx-169]|uniref:hypothetical protein n=1 Tax=Leucobacter sp. cx-169 TaxID=2770549 RepID=UPI00165D8438|nr:hypothetical protein [Leucobacter sp. cx-169]MBC9927263.1 hypothetical protein [Leucobacter sp. cx-169]